MRTPEIVLASLFSGIALAIPLLFRGSLQIVIAQIGFSATLASHVPSLLSIVIGPVPAAVVGLFHTFGFWATLGPLVAARAFTAVIWGPLAAFYVARGGSLLIALFVVAMPIHAFGEMLAVMAFGVPLPGATPTLFFTFIHHFLDSAITLAVIRGIRPIMVSLNIPYFKRRTSKNPQD